ncbi:uncharacterized protein DSM5745_10393 [Aspergillus mulundensis]|uniref:Uncharacterized protein n=1 Tax=Aspergillus mulundensis TaxID=1810919 RepID=A0A3D8QJ28_9EURO|nr:hypothetical protein DSM5745_10393 [Aspergillus mulundensis]RDW61721.1 hypothetical protein DSM5745_10393 [Aspergillus mulundensis]
MDRIYVAADIVAWAASWELILWATWLVTRHPRCIGGKMTPTVLLLLSIVLWGISNFAAALVRIFWRFPVDWTVYGNMLYVGFDILGIAHIVCLLLSWLVILRLWSKWSSLLKNEPESDVREQEWKAVRPELYERMRHLRRRRGHIRGTRGELYAGVRGGGGI